MAAHEKAARVQAAIEWAAYVEAIKEDAAQEKAVYLKAAKEDAAQYKAAYEKAIKEASELGSLEFQVKRPRLFRLGLSFISKATLNFCKSAPELSARAGLRTLACWIESELRNFGLISRKNSQQESSNVTKAFPMASFTASEGMYLPVQKPEV